MLSSLQPTKKYFLITFLISCILLESFTLVIYNQSQINKNTTEWVIRSYETLRLGRLAEVDSIDLAAAERDYLLTGYASNLKSYETTLADLDDKLQKLVDINAKDRDLSPNFQAFYQNVLALKDVSSEHIEAGRNGDTTFLAAHRAETETRGAVDEVRKSFESFSQNEVQLLDQRAHMATAKQKNYLWTLFMGGLLGLGALVIANLIIFTLIGKNSHAEEKLRKSEELFSTIINGINEGVFDYNVPEGTIYYANSYKAMLGYSDREMQTLSQDHDAFYEYMHPDNIEEAKETLRQYLAGETPTYYNTFRMRHRDGHWVWVMSRGIGIRDENGNIQRLIGTHSDITQQKRREEELNYFIHENEIQRRELGAAKEKAESANQAKSDFLATISHEIRTPMNSVIGLARLLLQTPLDAKQKEMTETLRVNADLLLQLVNELLDLSRIESGQMALESRPFTLRNVFHGLRAMFAAPTEAKGLKFELVNKVDEMVFLGDQTRIQQIIGNLVGNAIKFTGSGGITVTAEQGPRHGNRTDIRISVSDTGVGIPAEKLSAVFEKFVQADQTISRRFGGSGLGLAICQQLAHLMDGEIRVSSKIGEGSTFTFHVPLEIDTQAMPEAPPQAKAPAAAVAPASSGTILVVEDYAPNVMVATLMLEHLGYAADIARTGAEAIGKIESREKSYKAILMDVQMQDMDGFETTRRIRKWENEAGARHFIIGVTAHALAGDREKCLEAGMDDYMSKPIHPDLLAQKLGSLKKAA